jgi:hypothetical protein
MADNPRDQVMADNPRDHVMADNPRDPRLIIYKVKEKGEFAEC